ncbi:MAG: PQQ-like beta-propeller repeat protein [Tannerellaceae bacterium]|nr:PQQ-like beta-propeller repeat protein [Tannerellaceae bacterium]
MKEKKIVFWITAGVILIYTGLLIGWHLYVPVRQQFALHEPGADNRPEGLARTANDVVIGEYFMRYTEGTSSLTGKWNSFRGEHSNNIIITSDVLHTAPGDFPVAWSVETGEGHAAPVIYNGRAYFLDYDESLSSDALRCFSLETGQELWRRWYRVPIKRNHGFSRTIPVISEDYIITIGPRGM